MADSAGSIRKYREILQLDPGSRVFGMLAEELCAVGEWEEAAEVCGKGLLFHPDHMRARMLLGWALTEKGEFEEAERVVSSAVEEVLKNGPLFKRLSELAAASGKTESAAQYGRLYEALDAAGSVGRRTPEPEEADVLDVDGEAVSGRKIRFEDILEQFATNLEVRLSSAGAPAAILSESDRDFLKERIIALQGV